MNRRTKRCTTCGLRYDAAALFCQRDGAALRDERPASLGGHEEGEALLGRVLLGQFRLDAVLGAGGMGSVYRARQLGFDRDVAVKILHPEVARNPEAARRFEREARVSAQIDHPHVVRVLLFGRLEDGRSYLVMEYLPGESLADLLERTPRLEPTRALALLGQIADGLGAAHRRGVVHRDVKPENAIIVDAGTPDERLKLLDFGVARCLWGEHTMATETGLVFGTARYMSPEGAAGEATDARSDVYALGVLAYQLLTGGLPFDAPSPVSLLLLHVNSPPPPLPGYVPRPLARLVEAALAKDPRERPSDGDAFAQELRDAAQEAGIWLAGPLRAGSTPAPAPAPAALAQGPSPAASTPSPTAGRASFPTLLETGLARTDPITPLGPPLGHGAAPSQTPRTLPPAVARGSARRLGGAPSPSAPGPSALPWPSETPSPSPTPWPSPPVVPGAAAHPRGLFVWLAAFLVGAASVGGTAWALGAFERPPLPPASAASPALPGPDPAPAVETPAPDAPLAGVRVEPGRPTVGSAATLVAVVDPAAEVLPGATAYFRLRQRGRAVGDPLEAHAVADGRYVASATFPRAGLYGVGFDVELPPGSASETLTLSTEVDVDPAPPPAVARQRPRRPRRSAPANPAPRAVPASGDASEQGAIRWEISPGITPPADPVAPPEPAAPPPWTSDDADLL